MKVLVFQADTFSYQAEKRTSDLGEREPQTPSYDMENVLVAFVHCETRDADRGDGLVKQAVKYFEWLFRKRKISRLLLHSFAHLDEQRAPPEVARDILKALADDLRGKGYDVRETPFGWSLGWQLATPGHPYAKTFKVL